MTQAVERGLLPQTLAEFFSSGKVWDDQGNRIPLDSNVSQEEALLLYAAVRQIKPLRSLEVGLAKGVSTLAILGALQENGDGHHDVMDPFQEGYGNAGIEMVRRAGLEQWWEFHRKFAEEVIPSLRPIQFAFIDASHLFDLTLMEFVLVDKKLDVGGVVAFHDLWMPSLQSVFRYVVSNRDYEVWHPAVRVPVRLSSSSGFKHFLRRWVARVPGSERVFSQAFLHPWAVEEIGNLVFLRKRGNDEREWTFHQRF